MSEDKSNSSGELVKPPSARRKKPTLSEQIKEQAEQIEQLTLRLVEKEQELAILVNQADLIENLKNKLQVTEQSMQAKGEETRALARTIEQLRNHLREKGSQMLTAREQAELIDDLTLKVQEVEIKLAASNLQGKHLMAQNIVKTHMIAGMALGLLPAPLFDIAALTGTQLNLLYSISIHYGVAFDEQKGKTFVTSLIAGVLPVMTVVGLSSFAKLIPGIGTIGGGFSMVVLAGSITHAMGQVFIRHFEAGGTLQDFDAKHWQHYFREQLREGKTFVKRKLSLNSDNGRNEGVTLGF